MSLRGAIDRPGTDFDIDEVRRMERVHSTVRTSTASGVLSLFVLVCAVPVAGCGSSDEAKNNDNIALKTPKLTIAKEDGKIVKRYDTDADGTPNVVEYVEHSQDPENPKVTRKRVVRKNVDVDGDGAFDIIKRYDERGILKKEVIDGDLDGTPDRINYYNPNHKALIRKEVLADDGETVRTTRYYTGGKVDRVETDTDGNEKPDYFEYYEGGELQRIGRDTNGDGEIENWKHRRREKTVEAPEDGGPGPTSSAAESGGGGEGGGSAEGGGGGE